MKGIRVNTPEEIERLRESGRRLAGVMEHLIQAARLGVTTLTLGELADRLIADAGGTAIFKGYGRAWGAPPFPAAVCLSLNDEVVHGIPRAERVLGSGDLLKIDIGMRHGGMVTDMARTVPIGTISPLARRLLITTEDSLNAGIRVLRDGATLEEYARAVEERITEDGFAAVRDLVGHGVGRELHEEPQIPNYTGSRLPNVTLRAGMSVALEPMVNAGEFGVRLSADGWTFVTKDGSLSAHFEDTVLVTERGTEILTRPVASRSPSSDF